MSEHVHSWGPWEFAAVGDHEIRFCPCGDMEQQWIAEHPEGESGFVTTGETWERCTNCGQEYAFPHLCREHMLCGMCHCDPSMPNGWKAVDHDYEVVDQEYDSLANGGSYDVLLCRRCGRRAFSQLPD